MLTCLFEPVGTSKGKKVRETEFPSLFRNSRGILYYIYYTPNFLTKYTLSKVTTLKTTSLQEHKTLCVLTIAQDHVLLRAQILCALSYDPRLVTKSTRKFKFHYTLTHTLPVWKVVDILLAV